jgi:hypothetical protein
MAMNFPWPKKGQKAFVPESDVQAFRVRTDSPFFPQHATAFREAADKLLDNYVEYDNRPRDERFLPIAYLYRHALELRLKMIVMTGVAMGFFNHGRAEIALKGHGLAALWTLAKSLIIARWRDGDEVHAVEAVINEFHRADPSSQAFRYLRAASGKLHSHESLPESISPIALRSTMDAVFAFLESCGDGLDDSLSDMQSAAL